MDLRRPDSFREMSATSSLSPSPPPSSGLPHGFTPAITTAAATGPASNYRALSFAHAPAVSQFQQPLTRATQPALRNPKNQGPESYVAKTTTIQLRRDDSWKVPLCTSASTPGAYGSEATPVLPLVPEELDDYGLRFGTFATTNHASGSAVLAAVKQALARHPHVRLVRNDHTNPCTIQCATYPQGVAIRFAVRVFRLSNADQESAALQGLRGQNLVVIEEVQSSDCLCPKRPPIAQLFSKEIRNGSFRVPFAHENVLEGGCLIGQPCGATSQGSQDTVPMRSIPNATETCSQLLQLAASCQLMDVQEHALCVIARQSSSDPAFARALARANALVALSPLCAERLAPDTMVCVVTALANVAGALVHTDAIAGAAAALDTVTGLVRELESISDGVRGAAETQVLQQARRALEALRAECAPKQENSNLVAPVVLTDICSK
jgi:hypothetical protein